MPILESASLHDLKRILELFPLSNLRETWPDLKGTKEDRCFSIAAARDYGKMTEFLDVNFGCCKQHVYVFNHAPNLTELPDDLLGFGIVRGPRNIRTLYVIRTTYNVVLK